MDIRKTSRNENGEKSRWVNKMIFINYKKSKEERKKIERKTF